MVIPSIFTEVSLLDIQVLEIVIYLQIKWILDLHVQVHENFSPIIFSK